MKFRVKEGESLTFGTNDRDQRRYEAGELIEMAPESAKGLGDVLEVIKGEAPKK